MLWPGMLSLNISGLNKAGTNIPFWVMVCGLLLIEKVTEIEFYAMYNHCIWEMCCVQV